MAKNASFAQYLEAVAQASTQEPFSHHRVGYLYSIILQEWYPSMYGKIQGTSNSPLLNDSAIPQFINYLSQNWDN